MLILNGVPTVGLSNKKFKEGTKFDLIDRSARGEVEAMALLAEGYLKGIYKCEKNATKAKKWASYAAKKGSKLAEEVLTQLSCDRN